VSAASPPLFSVRLVAGWLAAAALACALSLFMLTRQSAPGQRAANAAPTIYSRSAIGYAALYHTLERLGIPVAEGTAAGGAPADAAVVVIAEPNRDENVLARVRTELRHARAVLLVLPKREALIDPEQPDRIRADRLLPAETVQRVLALADEHGTVGRESGLTPVQAKAPFAGLSPAVGSHMQLALYTALDPLLSAGGGTLIGELHGFAGRVIVVADPDLLENHGLVRGDNAAIAVALVRELRGASNGRVVFDEGVHGYVARPFGALRLLFSFPFVLVTAQIVIASVLLAWAGSARFGAPKPRAPALATGKHALIEAGARLFTAAGRLRFIADRYAEAVLRETAQALHAPRGLARDELLAWFERIGRPAPPLAAGDDASAAVADAQAMHTWRRDALDESGRRTQHR
jgi:hypothetical protein